MTGSRRTFLKGTAAAAGAAAGTTLPVLGERVLAGRDYDVAKSLPVDKVVRTTCSPNCTGSCGQLAFVRDGILVKVQQAADYPDTVYAPRGCMKGLSYVNQVYGADRIMTPLIRDGERGSGSFRQASWEEALDRVAQGLRDIGEHWGWDSVHVFGQVPGSGYVQKGANYRACALLGMTHGTSFDFNGDLPMGMPITFGVQNAEHEAKDWANSRFLLLVGSNPVETRIPDVHFLFDAIEQGARLVVIDPSFSPTAAKADTHLRIRPGTDAALALALCHVVVRDGLMDGAFMRTYTDGPLLVRTDTGQRLRAREVDPVGPEPGFVAWDPTAGAPVLVGTERLGFPDGVEPALDGRHQVALADGSIVEALPGFALVDQELAAWTPERGSRSRASRRMTSSGSHARSRPPIPPRSSWAAAPTTGTTATSTAVPSRCSPPSRATSGAPAVASRSMSVSTRCAWTRHRGGALGAPRPRSAPRSTSSAGAPTRCIPTCPTRRKAGTASYARSRTCSSRRWT